MSYNEGGLKHGGLADPSYWWIRPFQLKRPAAPFLDSGGSSFFG